MHLVHNAIHFNFLFSPAVFRILLWNVCRSLFVIISDPHIDTGQAFLHVILINVLRLWQGESRVFNDSTKQRLVLLVDFVYLWRQQGHHVFVPMPQVRGKHILIGSLYSRRLIPANHHLTIDCCPPLRKCVNGSGERGCLAPHRVAIYGILEVACSVRCRRGLWRSSLCAGAWWHSHVTIITSFLWLLGLEITILIDSFTQVRCSVTWYNFALSGGTKTLLHFLSLDAFNLLLGMLGLEFFDTPSASLILWL